MYVYTSFFLFYTKFMVAKTVEAPKTVMNETAVTLKKVKFLE